MGNSAIWLPWDKISVDTPRTESSLWRVTGNLLKFTSEYGGILVYREFTREYGGILVYRDSNKRVQRYPSIQGIYKRVRRYPSI